MRVHTIPQRQLRFALAVLTTEIIRYGIVIMSRMIESLKYVSTIINLPDFVQNLSLNLKFVE